MSPAKTGPAAELDRAANRYARAVERRNAAIAELADAIRTAHENGMNESEIARRAGVTRMTVRAWRERS